MLAYINGQSAPVTVTIDNTQAGEDGMTTFDAAYPADEEMVSGGLSVTTVVGVEQAFSNATQVAEKTLFGPGLIEYQ